MKKILVLHGPNLNLLGQRETGWYGKCSLDELNKQLMATTSHHLSCFQSNAEHVLIEKIHSSKAENVDLIIINPAAFTHTSIALRDALLAIETPFIEVHLSNIFAREPFRHHSYFSDKAIGIISGFGPESYLMALQFANKFLETE